VEISRPLSRFLDTIAIDSLGDATVGHEKCRGDVTVHRTTGAQSTQLPRPRDAAVTRRLIDDAPGGGDRLNRQTIKRYPL